MGSPVLINERMDRLQTVTKVDYRVTDRQRDKKVNKWVVRNITVVCQSLGVSGVPRGPPDCPGKRTQSETIYTPKP